MCVNVCVPVCVCCVGKVNANEKEMISDKYLREVLLQFQIADIQDTLSTEMTTLT